MVLLIQSPWYCPLPNTPKVLFKKLFSLWLIMVVKFCYEWDLCGIGVQTIASTTRGAPPALDFSGKDQRAFSKFLAYIKLLLQTTAGLTIFMIWIAKVSGTFIPGHTVSLGWPRRLGISMTMFLGIALSRSQLGYEPQDFSSLVKIHARNREPGHSCSWLRPLLSSPSPLKKILSQRRRSTWWGDGQSLHG